MNPNQRPHVRLPSASTLAVLAAVATSVTAVAVPPVAAPITWGLAQDIAGDGDVSTAGTLLYAYNVGGSGVTGQTVNGVAFAAYEFPVLFPPPGTNSVDNGTVAFLEIVDGGELFGNNSLGSPSSASLGAGYKSILSSGGGAMLFGSIVSTLRNLTVGRQYQLQLWVNNSNNGSVAPNPYNAGSDGSIFTAGLNSVTLTANMDGAVGDTGQYVLGEFTATAASHTFSFDGANYTLPLINAFQVRDITPIPGPGGAAVAVVLGALLPGGRRRRH